METIKDRLRKLLQGMDSEGKKPTYNKIANDLDVGLEAVKSWFIRGTTPEQSNIEKLAVYFGETPDYIRYGNNYDQANEGTVEYGKRPNCEEYIEKIRILEEKLELIYNHIDELNNEIDSIKNK